MTQWPRLHPGSRSELFGGRPYRYIVRFDLAAADLNGTFVLDVSLLFRHRVAPALDVDLNGHRGIFYFDPEPMFEVGSALDQFNPIRSIARRKLPAPAGFFREGENEIAFTAVDGPRPPGEGGGGPERGDSGFYYDAVALLHDPDGVPDDRPRASLTPTVFYVHGPKGLEEECQLTVEHVESWPGGMARVQVTDFTNTVDVPKGGEFGETRVLIRVPGDLSPGKAAIQLIPAGGDGVPETTGVFELEFTPARKWKVFYAPSMHLDIGYTDYRPKVAEVDARAMDELMNVLDRHPDYRFNVDATWVLEQWLSSRTEGQARRFSEHAAAARIGVNAFYDSFVTAYASPETFLHSLDVARRLQQDYDLPLDFAQITDIPSSSWAVPSLLAAAGVRYFAQASNQDRGPFIVHGHWNVKSPFWWEGPDGGRVLTWISSHYHHFRTLFGIPPSPSAGKDALARFLTVYEHAGYSPDAVLMYGTEVENVAIGYPDAAVIEAWNQQHEYPRIIPCRFSDFFRYIEEELGPSLPVVRGDGGAYWGENAGAFPPFGAQDRANQVRAVTADSLAAITSALDPVLRFPLEQSRDAWRNILLFGEHTFGPGRTASQPHHEEVLGQLQEKADQARRANSTIGQIIRRSLSQLANLIPTDGQNLLVFNPLSWTRSALATCQRDPGAVILDEMGQEVTYEVVEEREGFQTLNFVARDLPPLGYRTYRVRSGGPRIAMVSASSECIVENEFYHMTLDPERAAISSLYDKELNRELVDRAAAYRMNEYLFVSSRASGRGPEAGTLLHNWPWLPLSDLEIHQPGGGGPPEVRRTPWAWRIRMAARAYHTPRIETEILLPDAAKRVEIINRVGVELGFDPQSSYFAFPWALSDPVFRHDIPVGFVDPQKDLLEGACSEWLMAQHVVNAADASVSVDLAVVDAPLVCIGDIVRGRWPRQFEKRSSTVFSWVLNNHWSSKWMGRDAGEFTYRYAITSGAQFDPATTARFGREAGTPLERSEVKSIDKLPHQSGILPPHQASFASIAPDNVLLSALTRDEDGAGLIVRLREIGGLPCEGMVEFPFLTIASAQRCRALGEPFEPLRSDSHRVWFTIGPNQIITLRLTLADS